ncbi:WD40-repeat-containing domain protein [Lipomyces oligophaga]|uniref:WD40-repeat-containing domain protein n=1 Tax=Lipomyces oligophaga TaxID=45792 RepID=UPI0034CE692C
MPARDNVHIIVARYLRDNLYNKTFEAFKEEIGLEDEMIPSDHSMTLESILEQKRLYDLAQGIQELEISTKPEQEWHVPYPMFKTVLPVQSPESNILFVTIASISMPTSINDPESALSVRPCILVTSADRSLRIFDFYSLDLLKVYTHIHPSPILVLHVLNENTILTGGMDGKLVVSNPATGDVITQVKDHFKYLVKIAVSRDNKYLATTGYDKKVYVYTIFNAALDEEEPIAFEKIGTLTMPTNPEAVAFVNPLDASGSPAEVPQLVVSRRDSTFLYYYKLFPTLIELARHNLNPESNSWVSFCAMDIMLDPVEQKFLGIATSSIPHMRFMVLESGDDNIIQNGNTRAPQDAYSSSRITWRPQGSGVWCNGDDGVIRGFEVSTGKIVAELKHHDGKVKAMYSGMVDGREVLLTGGFDKTIVLWETEQR